MKNHLPLLLCLIIGSFQLEAQGIFDTTIHTAIVFGDVNSPPNESVQMVIDQDPETKFLDFNELDGIGFEVDLLGDAKIATSMAVVTANDAPERDPVDFEIFGSNDGSDFTSIATGTIPCVTDRFLSRIFSFNNTDTYSYYRINFTGTCNPSTINQIADVQLYTTIGNAPTLNCPEDIVVNTTAGDCSGIATFEVIANDVEDGMITPVQVIGSESGSPFPIGASPVVFAIEDSDGNVNSCDFTVTVEDEETPTFDCPENITVSLDAGQTEAVVNYNIAAMDNCSVINPIPGYTALGTIGDKSYYLSDTFLIIEDAFFHAFEAGGSLGTIRSEEDNNYLLDAILRSGAVGEFLIGYNDISSEGNFVWDSGDPSTYSNWGEGEPNNSGVGGVPENYTLLQTSGFWNDVASLENILYQYILEIDFVLLQTQGLPSGSAFPEGVTTNTFVAMDLEGNESTCEFDIMVGEASSVVDQELANSIIISPNPIADFVTITRTSDIALEEMTIYDIHGKLIRQIKVNSLDKDHNIDISNLLSGLYLLRLKGEHGIATKKMVKR